MKYQNVELHNVCDLKEEEGEAGFGISRLPLDVLPEINEGARRMLRMGSGCEIRGMLPDGGEAKVVLQVTDDNCLPPVASVFHGCFRGSKTELVGHEPTAILIEKPGNIVLLRKISAEQQLPFSPDLVRVRLPSIHPCQIISIEGDLTPPEPGSTPSTTMLSYGSSITHGAHAIPPEGTYAAQCARLLGCDLLNLGVGGSAQMDKAFADHIAGRDDWDFAAFEMGINVRNWPIEEFRAATDYFVSTIASAHPEKFIFCIDMFTCDQDFVEEQTAGVGFREAVAEIVARQNSPKVIHVDGRDILPSVTGLSVDVVHPTDTGMSDMGRNLAEKIQVAVLS